MLVIKAFGQGLPRLAAATRIWHRMFEDKELLAREGLAFMKHGWKSGDPEPQGSVAHRPASRTDDLR